MAQSRWELLPHFILRSTGVPFELMEQLVFTETGAALESLFEHEDKLALHTAAVLQELQSCKDAYSYKQRQYQWDRVSRNRPLAVGSDARRFLGRTLCESLERWEVFRQRRDELEVEARAAFSSEMPLRRQALRDLVAQDWFREAILLSSPHMLEFGLRPYLRHWDISKRPSGVRRVERQLVSYLQRFCTKNDTASYFGPINYGDFAQQNCPLPGPGLAKLQHRESFIAYWSVLALSKAMAEDCNIQPYLIPRISQVSRVDLVRSRAVIGEKINVSISTVGVQVLRCVDGMRTVKAIAELSKLSPERIREELARLAQVHLIQLWPDIPVTEARPLAWLLRWVESLPLDCSSRSTWQKLLATVQRLQDQFSGTSLDEKQVLLKQLEGIIADATGRAAQRSEGKLYADRLVIYEECLGGMSPLSLGTICKIELQEQLAPILDLYAAHACAVHQELQSFGIAQLVKLTPSGKMPLLSLLSRLNAEDVTFAPSNTVWQEAILAQIRNNTSARHVVLNSADLPPIDRSILGDATLLTSPDLMIVARDYSALRNGDFEVIVGEFHDTLMVSGWALCFHPDRGAVETSAEHLLRQASRGRQIANVLGGKRVKIIPFEYPGPTIEVRSTSTKNPSERIPIAEVSTGIEGEKPILQGRSWSSLQLYNGELTTLGHSMFSLPRVVTPPLGLDEHTPRITLGKAVIQRERWRLERSTLFPQRYQGASFELMRDFWRASRRLGLPRYLFARVPGELKPVFVDRFNYFLLELIDYLLPSEGTVVLSEMLPTPNQLWLQGDEGGFCAELRLSAFYVPGDEVNHA
jgi:hypothetical protein